MDAPTTTNSGYRDRNSTADRALTILEMFSETQPAISAVDVADKLSVARSTAYRYLESLVSRGYLEESPGGGFRLGIMVLKLAKVARSGYGLSEVALPRMRQLSERFGQTVVLTRRAGTSVVCLERVLSAGQLLRLSYERGSQLPLTAGASALVLMGWLGESEARNLLDSAERPRFTERTLTSVDDLIDRLKQIRAEGYSISHGEVDPDVLGLACPLFGHRGDVVAGLSIVGLGSRIDEAERVLMIAALKEAAHEISDILALSAG